MHKKNRMETTVMDPSDSQFNTIFKYIAKLDLKV